MAWFKQTEQKSPASREIQTPAASGPAALGPAAPVEHHAAPVSTPSPAPRAEAASSAVFSRITHGIVLRGDITGREDLSIDGELEGTLRLVGARLTVGATGRVRADVFAHEIVIHGEVRGDLHAEERIEIARTASVAGNASAKRVAIEDGAVFNGAVEVLRAGGAARAVESSSSSRTEVRPALRGGASLAPAESVTPAKTSSADAETPARGKSSSQSAWRDDPVAAGDKVN
jgi:cytoskeletal protein CcmA (bactofilin family)